MVSQTDFDKLARVCDSTELVTVLELLKVKNTKSEMRKRLKEKVETWLHTPAPIGKPLRSWEFQKALPHWPVKPLRSYITER